MGVQLSASERTDLVNLLPKIDLHLHLDGSLRPETIMEIACKEGIELPTGDTEQLIPYMRVGEECRDLRDYLSKFDFTTRFLQSAEALERVAYEAVEQSAVHNCKYVEVRFAPQLHRKNGMSVEEVVHVVTQGLKRGEAQFGVKAQGIVICMRNHSQERNIAAVEAAARYAGRGIAAVDLAGDEASYPPEFFREVFALSRRKGIPITIHAGEAAGAGNILEAVNSLGAARIGHGVRLREDEAIFEMVAERGVPLEMCPVSNIQTKAVAGWDAYPIREYFDRGIKVTVNTDNPSVSGTTITKEYRILSERFGFTNAELAKIVMNGADAAFLEEREKRELKRDIAAELYRLGVSV